MIIDRLSPSRISAILALGALLPVFTAAQPAPQSAASAVETTAVRALIGARRAGHFAIDSAFARPDQAPPAMTARLRPPARHQLLVAFIQSLQTPGAADTLAVRASDPQIRRDTATISVTIDGRTGGGQHGGRFYETVAFVLARDGARWIVRRRIQLGAS